MGLRDWIQRAFSAKAFEPDGATIGDIMEMVRRREPPNRGDRALLVAAQSIPEFAIAVRRISEAVASQPLDHTIDGSDVDDSRALSVLASPNQWMTGTQRRKVQEQFYTILGESIDVCIPADDREDGAPFDLFPVPPVDATREKDGNAIVWEIRTPDGARWMVPDDMILWRKDADLLDLYGRGTGLAEVLRDEVEIIEYSAAFEKAEYYNDARPSMIVSLEGKDKAALKAFKEQWLQKFRGPGKAKQPMFDNSAVAPQITELSRSIRDTEVLKGRRAHGDIVQQTFGIPPIYASKVENANRANAFVQRQIWGEQVVDPRTSDECEFYNTRLLPLLDEEGTIAAKSASPQDFEQRLQAIEARPETATVNEIREMQGLPPIEGGNVFLRPSAMEMREVPAGEPEADLASARTAKDAQVDWSNVVVELSEYRKGPDEDALEIASAIPLENLDDSEARQYYQNQLQETAGETANALGLSFGEDGDISMALLNPAFETFAAEQGAELIRGVNETTKERVRELVATGIREGKNPLAIARDLRRDDSNTFSAARSRAIARTEAVKTVEYGKLQTWSASGLVPQREWVATFDTQTRPEHAGLHGTRAKLDEPFDIGGLSAMHPGAFGDPAQDINCRCGTVPWIDEDSPELTPFPDDILDQISGEERAMVEARAKQTGRSLLDEVKRFAWWKVFDEQVANAEGAMVALMQERFDQQIDDVIRRLEDVLDVDASEATA